MASCYSPHMQSLKQGCTSHPSCVRASMFPVAHHTLVHSLAHLPLLAARIKKTGPTRLHRAEAGLRHVH